MLSIVGGASAMSCLRRVYPVVMNPVVMIRVKCSIIVEIDHLRVRVKK